MLNSRPGIDKTFNLPGKIRDIGHPITAMVGMENAKMP